MSREELLEVIRKYNRAQARNLEHPEADPETLARAMAYIGEMVLQEIRDALIDSAIAAETERCAKVAEDHADDDRDSAMERALEIAEAIRASLPRITEKAHK